MIDGGSKKEEKFFQKVSGKNKIYTQEDS